MRIIDSIREKHRLEKYNWMLRGYLKNAAAAIELYKGQEPLANFLKKYFAADKKFGSKDRKNISALCYTYFRLGHVAKDMPTEERILLGIFLCETASNPLLNLIKPEWNENISIAVDEKIKLSGVAFKPTDIFPWVHELSEGIAKAEFAFSHLIQPDLFVRIRLKKRLDMMQRLEKTGWPYTMMDEDCIALPNGCNAEEVFDIDRQAVVQDYNSQQVFNYALKTDVQKKLAPFRKYYTEFRNVKVLKVFDCCAGSGGKAMLLYDLLGHSVKPTVCDIRLPILLNLHQRFKKANLRYYDYFVGDMEKNVLPAIADSPFPLVVCDAPCTGSGTWGRTPEQLFYFDEKTIDSYAERQKKIVTHAIPHLAAGGLFFYITCSIFKKENEEVAAFIQKKFKLKPVHTELLQGWDKKADSMFVAVFEK